MDTAASTAILANTLRQCSIVDKYNRNTGKSEYGFEEMCLQIPIGQILIDSPERAQNGHCHIERHPREALTVQSDRR